MIVNFNFSNWSIKVYRQNTPWEKAIYGLNWFWDVYAKIMSSSCTLIRSVFFFLIHSPKQNRERKQWKKKLNGVIHKPRRICGLIGWGGWSLRFIQSSKFLWTKVNKGVRTAQRGPQFDLRGLWTAPLSFSRSLSCFSGKMSEKKEKPAYANAFMSLLFWNCCCWNVLCSDRSS